MTQVTLAGARVSAGKTQQELADELEISRDLLLKMEGGKVKVRTVYLYAICMATGFKPADILLPS